MNKISWDDYFLSMAYVAATRSPDVHTKCGAVIVDGENRIISVGYNGPVRGLDDTKVNWDRPDGDKPNKHRWVIHAEINALAAASLDKNTPYKIYTTGHPCLSCMQTCVQNGINTFIFEQGQRIHSLEGQESYFLDFFRAAGAVWEDENYDKPSFPSSYISCSSYSYGKRIEIEIPNPLHLKGMNKTIQIIPLDGTYQALERAHQKVSNAYLRGLS